MSNLKYSYMELFAMAFQVYALHLHSSVIALLMEESAHKFAVLGLVISKVGRRVIFSACRIWLQEKD